MGGMVAQELALADPERVLTLTLGATYCGGPRRAVHRRRASSATLAAAILSGDPDRKIRAGWEFNVSPAYAAPTGNFERFAEVAALHPVAAADAHARSSQAIIGHDTSERLAEIDAPTLVVHGTADQMLAVTNGELVAGLIPGARLELLDGVGHLFFWEQPERVAELVAEHAATARPRAA